MYGINGRLNQKFLSSTKTALENTANLDTSLLESHPLELDESSLSGVSRLSAHLHLLYHQVCLPNVILVMHLTNYIQSA